MNILKELKIVLRDENSNEYFKEGVPSTMSRVDVELNRILGEFNLLSKEEIESLRENISTDMAWLLLSFAENMATYSLRLSKQELFSRGLSALSLVLGILDKREIILIMSLYYDVHKRVGLSFERITYPKDKFNMFVEEFLKRDENDKSLNSMGYIYTKDENGNSIYQRTW